MALADTIRENYPQYAWAINDPELGPLLREAVNPAQPFSATHFRAKLMATKWWRTRSESQRAWDILKHTDPGAANQSRAQFMTQLYNLAGKLGVNLTSAQKRWITESALQRGLGADSQEVMAGLARIYGNKTGGGQLGASRRQVQQMARNEYMVPVSQREMNSWGNGLVLGTRTEEAIRMEMAKRAASRYPHLKTELIAGKSMRDLFDGHIQTIAEELELDPQNVNLMDARWNKVLDTYDSGANVHRAATLSETMSLARRDNRFWKTTNGRAMGSSLSTMLLKEFGKR